MNQIKIKEIILYFGGFFLIFMTLSTVNKNLDNSITVVGNFNFYYVYVTIFIMNIILLALYIIIGLAIAFDDPYSSFPIY